MEQRSTPFARKSQYKHTPNLHPPPVVVLVVSNKSQARAVSNAQTGCPSLSPPSFVGRERGTCNTAHCILPPSTAFERSLQGVCALAPVAGRLTSVTYHGQTVPKYEPHREVSAEKTNKRGKYFEIESVSKSHICMSLFHCCTEQFTAATLLHFVPSFMCLKVKFSRSCTSV